MLYSETIAVCSQIHTKHINTLFGQNVEFLNAEPAQCCIPHIISYILFELRRRSIYFKFAVNGLLFAEIIINLALNMFLYTN